jgi:hypothetical protein
MRRNGRQRLESFVEEWWFLYAEPNLERSTLAVYRWAAEGRLSIIEIAAQLGHNPTVCLDIYGHEMAERAATGVSAEGRIWKARAEVDGLA